jgi:DNA-binding MarR family transcriptional regulator
MDPRTGTPTGTPTAAPAAKRRFARAEHVAATEFLYAIIEAADRLREARAFNGAPALPLDARSDLLSAIERCGGAPSFADLARLLGVSRPSARARALAAVATGVVELFPCPDDRRLIQVALTPAGRRVLEAQRLPALDWLFTLLNGLTPAAMKSADHVLRVLAARLGRYEKEMRSCRARRAIPGA